MRLSIYLAILLLMTSEVGAQAQQKNWSEKKESLVCIDKTWILKDEKVTENKIHVLVERYRKVGNKKPISTIAEVAGRYAKKRLGPGEVLYDEFLYPRGYAPERKNKVVLFLTDSEVKRIEIKSKNSGKSIETVAQEFLSEAIERKWNEPSATNVQSVNPSH